MPDEKRDGVPDIYCNGVQIGVSPYDLTIELQLNSPPTGGEKQSPPALVGKVRMSLEHAKIFAIILKKQLKAYEDQTGGAIRVHRNLLQELGVSNEEDW